MKKAMYVIAAVFAVLVAAVAIMVLMSHTPPKNGMVKGKLVPCPGDPNCVCSEYKSKLHYVEPFTFNDTPGSAWDRIKKTIRKGGGKIVEEKEDYLWATFSTPFLRFVDDVEVRMSEGDKLIHIRSASRIGYSDMGMNKKRVRDLRKLFNPAD